MQSLQIKKRDGCGDKRMQSLQIKKKDGFGDKNISLSPLRAPFFRLGHQALLFTWNEQADDLAYQALPTQTN